MTPERWKRVTELFGAALAQEPAGRADFLAQAAADDSTLVAEVLRMLVSDQKAGTFLSTWDRLPYLRIGALPTESVR